MKTIFYSLLGLLLLALFAGTTWFLYQKSQSPPVIFQTTTPMATDIEQVTVATGVLVPRKEIQIKPQVRGIIKEIYVQPGDVVEKGQTLARIGIIPSLTSVNEAENRLKKAQIYYANAKQELARQDKLYQKQLISQAEFKKYQLDYNTALADLQAAQNNLQLVKEGVTKEQADMNNNTLIASTVAGMVLEVPIKEGNTVIEANNFNEGTTVATIADMEALVFEGSIDESEVGKLQEGMPLKLTLGALEDETLQATLEYIAPKGAKSEDGAVQFQIKAAVEPKEGVLVRAGYSANAKIVLARKAPVLAIQESLVHYDKDDTAYVEIERAEQEFIKQPVELGLSDGINVEVVSGLTQSDRLKQPLLGGSRPRGGR
jgi:HlyD family secretion protein